MVFVTGATGILGRVILLELLRRGKSVRAAKRQNSDLEDVRRSFSFYVENPDDYFAQIEWYNIDFEDAENLSAALAGVDEVYHCAAKVSFHPSARREMIRSNYEATRALLYACEGSSVKKFCYISSIAVLDGINEIGEVDETCDFVPENPHSDYAQTKNLAELEVWRASAEGMNTVIVNPGVIIGSGNWKSSSGTMFETLRKSPFTTSGSTAYVDVRDVAKIAAELMERNIFGERFVLVSGNETFEKVANFVREKSGLKSAGVVSDAVLKAGSVLSSVAGWAIPPLRMLNSVNIEAVTSRPVVSNKKISQLLDYQFIPVFESLDFHLGNYLKQTK